MNIFPSFYLFDLPEDFALTRSSLLKGHQSSFSPPQKMNSTNETNFIIKTKINNLIFVKTFLYVFGRYELRGFWVSFLRRKKYFQKSLVFMFSGIFAKKIIKYSTLWASLFCAIQCAVYDFQSSTICQVENASRRTSQKPFQHWGFWGGMN